MAITRQSTIYNLQSTIPTRLVAVVPVKDLEQAKSRLGGALDPEERAELAASLLRRTLRVINAAGVVANWAVISPDDAVMRIAHEMDVTAIRQRAGDLNTALELGRDWAAEQHADALLVLPTDLPLLCAEDIIALRDMSTEPSLVIAPDHAGSGTNALLLRPLDVVPFHFGANSYRLHLDAAAQAEVPVHTYHSPRTEWDLDTPPDMETLATGGHCRSDLSFSRATPEGTTNNAQP
jgi:2-phospho-L-lactate/phosphoenolpyruvate guanylyltransferase